MFSFKRKSDNEIVAEIHSAIDSAQDRLLEEAKKIIAGVESMLSQNGDWRQAIRL